jgi:hypothetical protein
MRKVPNSLLFTALALLARAAAPQAAVAQASRAGGCPVAPHPYFQFQVDRAAAFIALDSARPRPAPPSARHPGRPMFLVQFVVDTVGTPDLLTFKTVIAPSRAAADSARQAAARWRFTPAVLGECKVPQMVQMEVER